MITEFSKVTGYKIDTEKHLEFLQTNNKKIRKRQKAPNSQSNLEQKDIPGGINLLGIRLYYKATVIKTVWYWHKNRTRNQQNKIETQKINPCPYGQLIFDEGGKNIQWIKDSLFTKCFWIK